MNRRRFVGSMGVALAASLATAVLGERRVRIGYLVPFTYRGTEAGLNAFRAALRELGYEEGRNLEIEIRSPEGRTDRLPALADELVALNVDVLVTGGTRAVLALKRATSSIPIVFTAVGDAVETGVVKSLARPGGNLTGTTFFIQDLYVKRLELLREAVPRLREAAVLVDPTNAAIERNIKKMEAAAAAMGIRLHRVEARSPDEFEGAFAAIDRKGVQAVVVVESPMLTPNVALTAGLAAKSRLPSSGNAQFGKAGGIIGYGINYTDSVRRAAYFVDRILRGASPADLPVEQPTRFELVINLKTARALDLSIPRPILLRADQVIE